MHRALVAQWIERSPAKAEVVGSNPAKRAISRTANQPWPRNSLSQLNASIQQIACITSEMPHNPSAIFPLVATERSVSVPYAHNENGIARTIIGKDTKLP